MASGLPVFATTHGGIPEAIEHGVSGVLVAEARRGRARARVVAGQLRSPKLLAAIAQRGADGRRGKIRATARKCARLERLLFRGDALAHAIRGNKLLELLRDAAEGKTLGRARLCDRDGRSVEPSVPGATAARSRPAQRWIGLRRITPESDADRSRRFRRRKAAGRARRRPRPARARSWCRVGKRSCAARPRAGNSHSSSAPSAPAAFPAAKPNCCQQPRFPFRCRHRKP